ncbi:MAG: hypothetical protein NUW21_03530, partial [Elusimicrobia bacterium]|nr:hypothetical protein [Elusimicrobiota bacterium]
MTRLLLCGLLLAACSHPRPVVYPDERYKAGGEEAAKADADLCLKEAKAYLKANPARRVAARTTRGGVFGALLGVVFGAFTGNYRRAVAEGAAVGAGPPVVPRECAEHHAQEGAEHAAARRPGRDA